VGKWKTCFWFSTFPSAPHRRSCGNVGISRAFGEIPKALVERGGSLPLAFHAFHSPGISRALRWLCWQQKDLSRARPPLRHGRVRKRFAAGQVLPALSRFLLEPNIGYRQTGDPSLPGPACRFCSLPIRASPGYRSSLLSRISSLNCHPSKLINMRPNSCQVISRPSTFSCGTEPSWESSHSIFPRTTR
jgi:hypothetical protein